MKESNKHTTKHLCPTTPRGLPLLSSHASWWLHRCKHTLPSARSPKTLLQLGETCLFKSLAFNNKDALIACLLACLLAYLVGKHQNIVLVRSIMSTTKQVRAIQASRCPTFAAFMVHSKSVAELYVLEGNLLVRKLDGTTARLSGCVTKRQKVVTLQVRQTFTKTTKTPSKTRLKQIN